MLDETSHPDSLRTEGSISAASWFLIFKWDSMKILMYSNLDFQKAPWNSGCVGSNAAIWHQFKKKCSKWSDSNGVDCKDVNKIRRKITIMGLKPSVHKTLDGSTANSSGFSWSSASLLPRCLDFSSCQVKDCPTYCYPGAAVSRLDPTWRYSI